VTRKNQLAESVEQKSEATEVKRVKINWVRLDSSVPSIYANQVELHATNWDFRFRFGEAFDIQTENATVLERTRIIMSPQHAKAFLNALSDNVRKYEAAFGEIRFNPKEKEAADKLSKPQ